MDIVKSTQKIGEISYDMDESTGYCFSMDLGTGIYESLDRIAGDLFLLGIEEYRDGVEHPTLTVEVSNVKDYKLQEAFVPKPEEGLRLFETTLVERYNALNLHDYDEDYSGHVVIKLVMFGEAGEKDCIVPNALAKDLVSIALCHYLQKIVQFYPDWRTLYLDAPNADTNEIDGL